MNIRFLVRNLNVQYHKINFLLTRTAVNDNFFSKYLFRQFYKREPARTANLYFSLINCSRFSDEKGLDNG